MPKKTRFTDLLGSYEKEIHRYAFRMTGNPEDAADVLQDTFLKAFKAFPRLPADANHRAWLYRIAHRQALNLFRSQKVRATEPLEDAFGVDDNNGHPDDLAETRRLVQALRHVIRALTPRQRSALLLRKYEGLPYRDVADILGCSEDNARAQVYQAMKKVRSGLKQREIKMKNLDLLEPTSSVWKQAHASLMEAFDSVRVFYDWIDAPFGKVFLAKTDRGLCRVSFRRQEDDLVDDLEKRELLPEKGTDELDPERRQFEEYFEGKRQHFDLSIDIRGGTPFQRKVLEAANEIPFGACECYTDVAERIGHPKAQRAVGNALGKNPIAIVIPCHRVVASGGGLGGYTGGLDIKKTLMSIEGIQVEEKA